MPDVFTQARRSEVMARIRSHGNADTELALAKLLLANGISGWRRQLQVRIVERGTRSSSRGNEAQTANRKSVRASSRRLLRVRPDFVFRQVRLAVFVDGCFWHGCPKHATQPKGNAAFWRRKLAANRARDRRVNRVLRAAGWCVLRIWEHELRQSEILLRARLRRTGRKAGMRGRGNFQPSTLNLQPRTKSERGTSPVIRRIQRAIAENQQGQDSYP
ncbi:MAG: hypothetical protein KF791_01400 [Verrucomicrobiae bacterium]|nr:hypothetical protein [Verrucomicrobiae bacterium]